MAITDEEVTELAKEWIKKDYFIRDDVTNGEMMNLSHYLDCVLFLKGLKSPVNLNEKLKIVKPLVLKWMEQKNKK